MPGGRRLDHVTWNRRLGELQRFQQRHGHTIVPQDVPKLGVWVKLQRSRHRRGLLPHDRQQKLQNMGFDFQWRGTICNGTRKNNKSSTTTDSSSMKRKTSSWDRYFPVVKELVAEGGDLDKLKHSFKYKGLAIGVWKWKQQSMYNKCCRGGKAFSKQRFDLLTKLGFKDTSRGGEEDESSVALVGTMTPRQMPNRTGRSNNYAEHTNDEVTPAGECDDDDDDDESFKTPTSQGVRTYRKHNGETKSRYPIRSKHASHSQEPLLGIPISLINSFQGNLSSNVAQSPQQSYLALWAIDDQIADWTLRVKSLQDDGTSSFRDYKVHRNRLITGRRKCKALKYRWCNTKSKEFGMTTLNLRSSNAVLMPDVLQYLRNEDWKLDLNSANVVAFYNLGGVLGIDALSREAADFIVSDVSYGNLPTYFEAIDQIEDDTISDMIGPCLIRRSSTLNARDARILSPETCLRLLETAVRRPHLSNPASQLVAKVCASRSLSPELFLALTDPHFLPTIDRSAIIPLMVMEARLIEPRSDTTTTSLQSRCAKGLSQLDPSTATGALAVAIFESIYSEMDSRSLPKSHSTL